MDDFKKANINNENNRNQKIKMSEIAEVSEKKRAVESCIKGFVSDSESYSIIAEEKSDLSHFAKANSFRYTLCEKK